jgi:hypothetical protein
MIVEISAAVVRAEFVPMFAACRHKPRRRQIPPGLDPAPRKTLPALVEHFHCH